MGKRAVKYAHKIDQLMYDNVFSFQLSYKNKATRNSGGIVKHCSGAIGLFAVAALFTACGGGGGGGSSAPAANPPPAPTNRAPTPVNDSYTVEQGQAIAGNPNVLLNDSDPDDDALSAELETFPVHYSNFQFNPDGSFTYVHNGTSTTTDSFTYRARDALTSAVAVVTINVTPSPTDASPGGVWEGQFIDSIGGRFDVIGVVTEDGHARFIQLDPGIQIFGNLEVSGNQVSGDLDGAVSLGIQLPDGSTWGTVAVTGQIAERTRMSGSFTSVGNNGGVETGTFDLLYNAIYERDSSLAAVAGTYASANDPTFIVEIDESGNASASSSLSACNVNGFIAPVDTDYNAYDVVFVYDSCTGEEAIVNGITFNGLAVLSDFYEPSDWLILQASAGIGASGFIVITNNFLRADVAGEARPSDFPAGTDVSNAYPGVVLATAQGSMIVNDLDVTEPLHLISDSRTPVFSTGSLFAHSGGAIWSAGQCCGGDQVLRMDFLGTVYTVSVGFVPTDTDTAVLQIYDDQGQLLGEVLDRKSSPFVLILNSPGTAIAYALATFGDTGQIDYVAFGH